LTLEFTAPKAAPQWHEFVATVSFANGQTHRTKQFKNAWHGKRSSSFEVYSRKQGCWASKATTVTRLSVIGCAGGNCVPGAKGGARTGPKSECEYYMKCLYKAERFKAIPPPCYAWVKAWSPGRHLCGGGWVEARKKATATCQRRRRQPINFCNVVRSKVLRVK
jgi:hypothetical protein